MRRRPPLPTLFPYTTLFRSRPRNRSALDHRDPGLELRRERPLGVVADADRAVDVLEGLLEQLGGAGRVRLRQRSEEHTSELQSRRDLVCRLLLEKKKNARTH